MICSQLVVFVILIAVSSGQSAGEIIVIIIIKYTLMIKQRNTASDQHLQVLDTLQLLIRLSWRTKCWSSHPLRTCPLSHLHVISLNYNPEWFGDSLWFQSRVNGGEHGGQWVIESGDWLSLFSSRTPHFVRKVFLVFQPNSAAADICKFQPIPTDQQSGVIKSETLQTEPTETHWELPQRTLRPRAHFQHAATQWPIRDQQGILH